MSNMIFSPKLRGDNDAVEKWLLAIAQYVLVGTMAVAPLLFIPQAFIAVGFVKSFVVLVGVLAALIVFSLFVLRVGTIRMVAPVVLLSLWGVATLAVASALLSGDRLDALVGDILQTQTAGFFLLLALVTTVTALVLDAKSVIVRFLFIFAAGAFVLLSWHVLRLFFGADFLSMGIFTVPTVSPLGSFNDVAIFSGLLIILSIIALIQLPLGRAAFSFVGTIVGLALLLRAVINFFAVWLIVGFFSLLVLLYMLTKDRLLSVPEAAPMVPVAKSVLAVLGVVCVVSAVFVVAGSYVGTSLNSALGIQYVEVRPSFSATLDIMSNVYKNDGVFFGVGPNRFEDAWRMHKDATISETLFWNTNFVAGSGYVPTLFITFGLVAGVVLVAFLLSLLYAGYRMLVVPTAPDAFWYFVATASFAAAVFLWGMAVIYVPGTLLLLMAAFWTGLSLVAYSQLLPQRLYTFSFTLNRPRAFVLIGAVMVVITLSVGALFVVSKQFVAHVVYAEALADAAEDGNVVAADASLSRAFSLFASDVYVAEQTRLRLGTLGNLLSVTNPSAEDQERFQVVAVEALQQARQMVELDSTNPANHALLGSLYGVLALTGVENARTLSSESLDRAQALDPRNPEYALIKAQIATRLGDLTAARTETVASLSRKTNYVDALFLLSQIDITEGNTEAAIATSRSIISIEPQNPARYFQLGSLLAATQDFPGAATAFENALILDPNFANARYLLALVMIEQGRRDDAIGALKKVAETNGDNAELAALIKALEAGETVRPGLGVTPPVTEPTVEVGEDGVAVTDGESDTDLVVPVNQTGGAASDSEVPADEAPSDTATETPPATE